MLSNCHTDNPLLPVWLQATKRAGWFKVHFDVDQVLAKFLHVLRDCDDCLFLATLNLEQHNESKIRLDDPARSLLQQLVVSGLSLRTSWHRSWWLAIHEWLGNRFYLSHSSNFSPTQRYASLVSSQIGRHGSKLPNWPSLVDAVLCNSHRKHERPLIVPDASLSDATQQFSERADLNSLRVRIDNRLQVEVWLTQMLSHLTVAFEENHLKSMAESLARELILSPPANLGYTHPACELPIQDRVAISLGDSIMAIHVRKNGNIATLLDLRLADSRFPSASVFVTATFGQQSLATPDFDAWLQRGAIGWLLPEHNDEPDRSLANCNRQPQPFIQSLCCCLPSRWTKDELNQTEWPYLTHCTRGNAGPLPDEAFEHYLDRAWSAGAVPTAHAISTLQHIVNDHRILGNSQLTRSEDPCVSFSEVPLLELLSRRQFRSHLGRWDWEPYGILVQREALEQLGARRVIYGEEEDYKQLAKGDQPYFQLRGTKNARTHHDWSCEREWRFVGDLNLRNLPPDAVIAFVATQLEAQQLSRRCPWPVYWTASIDRFAGRAASKK